MNRLTFWLGALCQVLLARPIAAQDSDGRLVAQGRDRGARLGPVFGLGIPGDLGLVVRAGVSQTRYAFRLYPEAGRTLLAAEYATGVGAWRFTASVDQRREGTRFHLTALARMSELEVLNFHGLGNATASGPAGSFRVEQKQWRLEPALAIALGSRSDLSVGPVLQYSTTDFGSNDFISTTRPYGSGDFGQTGLRVGLVYDVRDRAAAPRNGIRFDVSATGYPAIWDVAKAFGVLSAASALHYTIPVPLQPILIVRANAKKVLGEFPFQESAFIGGSGSLRLLKLQRYAGDASLGATTELRFPLGRVPLVLPLDLGVYGFADAGRVFVNGASPGGWHSGIGVGLWVSILSPTTALNLEMGVAEGRSRIRVKTGLAF